MMNYQRLMSQPLPTYSKGEEVFNLVTHIVGGAMGIIFLVIGIIIGGMHHLSVSGFASIIIYGICVITLYTISSVYHGLSPKRLSKKVLRILDHCTIYLLIAGTYTPILVLAMDKTVIGVVLFLIEWIGALVGIVLNAMDMENKAVKIISMFLYIVMGWAIIFFPTAIGYLSISSFIYILIGGIMYTAGVLFYGMGPKKKWFHSIFHIFCDLGTFIQFIGIIYILVNM